jgi:enoyl-CoA hydratase/carnithine racemase
MIFSGEPIAADVAERWGLANEIVPAASLGDRVTALAGKIADNAPVAVQTAKQLIAGSSPRRWNRWPPRLTHSVRTPKKG